MTKIFSSLLTIIFVFNFAHTTTNPIDSELLKPNRSSLSTQAFCARLLWRLAPPTAPTTAIVDLLEDPSTSWDELRSREGINPDLIAAIQELKTSWGLAADHIQETLANAILNNWNFGAVPLNTDALLELIYFAGIDSAIYINTLNKLGLRVEQIQPLLQNPMHSSAIAQLMHILGLDSSHTSIIALQQQGLFPKADVSYPHLYFLLTWMAEQISNFALDQALTTITHVMRELEKNSAPWDLLPILIQHYPRVPLITAAVTANAITATGNSGSRATAVGIASRLSITAA